MCGRYVTPDKEAVLLRWPKIRCDVQTTWQHGTNVAPTRTVPILIQAPDGGLAVQAARWTRLADCPGFIHSFNGPHSLFVDTIRACRSLAVAQQFGHCLLYISPSQRDRNQHR